MLCWGVKGHFGGIELSDESSLRTKRMMPVVMKLTSALKVDDIKFVKSL